MSLSITPVTVSLNNAKTVSCESLVISKGEHTIIAGLNGSGKSVLAEVLAQQGKVVSGSRTVDGKVGWVSVTLQQSIIEAERRKDDADILDVLPTPSTVQEIILQPYTEADSKINDMLRLAELLGITGLLEREFLALSTGETRKVLIVQQLLLQPDWLILDEPFDGLDSQTTARFAEYLATINDHCTVIMVVNRMSEIPPWAKRLLFLKEQKIAWELTGDPLSEDDLKPLHQIMHMHQHVEVLPDRDTHCYAPQIEDPNAPLVKLTNGRVAWGDNVVFENLNWTVSPGQHWQIVGPNGSGKTCLLTLITGDNPMCYSNDLNVFGFQRGNGESIWEIKQYMGIISNSLHLQYRVNCSVLEVICSGFLDSIGVYKKISDHQRSLAHQWLELLGMADMAATPFQSVSFGDQRLLLIARAMVKHPSLLILDEPCNGLDDVNRTKVLTMLELLARQATTTLLYVNHHSEDKIPSIQHQLDMRDYQA